MSFMAMIERQPEQRKRPAFVALSFLLHTGQLITRGKVEEPAPSPPFLKNSRDSSMLDFILKN